MSLFCRPVYCFVFVCLSVSIQGSHLSAQQIWTYFFLFVCLFVLIQGSLLRTYWIWSCVNFTPINQQWISLHVWEMWGREEQLWWMEHHLELCPCNPRVGGLSSGKSVRSFDYQIFISILWNVAFKTTNTVEHGQKIKKFKLIHSGQKCFIRMVFGWKTG